MASNAKNLAEYLNNQTTSATADIADGSITTDKLAADAVTAAKLADNAVVTANLAADAVTAAKLADNAVVTANLADDAITSAKLGANAVDATALASNAVTNAKIADDAIQTENINSSVNLGRRNLLINGNFDVWQRATSFTDIAGIWFYGHADRWNGHNDGTNAGTWSQSTVVPNAGSTYSMLLTGATSVTNSNFSQRIESTSLKGIREKDSFTISGYVRSATAGKVINVAALCPTATDNYSSYSQHGTVMTSVTISGNGGTGTSQITLTDANTWYYFTMTKTSATSLTNFDKGYAVFFSVVGQTSTSHQVYMSQLQIEAGEQATPFEHRSVAEELSLCQRYYYRRTVGTSYVEYMPYAIAYGTTDIQGGAFHPVKMRSSPALAFSGVLKVSQGNAVVTSSSSFSFTSVSTADSMVFYTHGSAFSGLTQFRGYSVYGNTNDYMEVSSEL